jgi:hypothetical protein
MTYTRNPYPRPYGYPYSGAINYGYGCLGGSCYLPYGPYGIPPCSVSPYAYLPYAYSNCRPY